MLEAYRATKGRHRLVGSPRGGEAVAAHGRFFLEEPVRFTLLRQTLAHADEPQLELAARAVAERYDRQRRRLAAALADAEGIDEKLADELSYLLLGISTGVLALATATQPLAPTPRNFTAC